jgi:hypothetical protein
MSRRALERVLWTTTLAAGLASPILRARTRARVEGPPVAAPARARLVPPVLPTADSLESAAETIAADNLFRPDRSPADPAPAAAAAPAPGMPPVGFQPPSTKPRLVLRGILGGPPWDALIEGLPGREGAIVARAGQTISGLTIRAVRRDTVFVRGFDTTWTLTLGRSW